MATIGNLNVVISATAGGFMSVLGRAGGMLATFGIQATGVQGMMLGLSTSFIALGKNAVETAADFESMEIAFTSLAGGAQQAKDLLDKLTKLGAETPFEFKDLAKSTQLLMTYGFEAKDAFGIISRLGDLAAASPQGMAEGLNRISLAIGQIRAKSKTSSQELNQLAEAGVNAREAIAVRLGVDVPKAMQMIEAGTVDAKTGIQAILDLAASPKFAGMMQRQSQSLNGLFSTLRDNASLMMRDVGRVMIEGFDLKGTTRAISAFVGSLRSQLDGLRPPLMLVGAGFTALRDVALAAAFKVTDALRAWGLSLNATPARLTMLREMVIGTFESMAQAIRKAAYFVVQEFMIPLTKFLADASFGFANMAHMMGKLPGQSQATWDAIAGGLQSLGKKLDRAGGLFGLEQTAAQLSLAEISVKNFFSAVRLSPLRAMIEDMKELKNSAIGVAQQLGKGGPVGFAMAALAAGAGIPALMGKLGLAQKGAAPFNLDMPGANKAAVPEIKLAPAALADTAEAFSIGVKDTLQRSIMGIGPQDKVVNAVEKGNRELRGVNDNIRQLANNVERNGLEPF